MTATRIAPTEITDPGGVAGDVYAAAIAEEVNNLWNGVITQTGTITGTADAIAAVCAPVLVADPVNGQTFRLKPGANNTGAVTINLDARGAIALKDEDGGALTAGDLVNGRPFTFWYDSGASYYRLTNPSTAALLDALAAEIAASTYLELIGDTTISAPVALVEHTFTANAYLEIRSYGTGVSVTGTGVSIDFTLRNAGGAVVTSSPYTVNSAPFSSFFGQAIIDILSATKRHFASIARGTVNNSPGVDSTGADGAHATAVDRIRWAASSGNLDAGRLVTFGIRVPV